MTLEQNEGTDRRKDGRREILFNELFHVENTNFTICCLFCSQVVSLSVIMTVHGLHPDIYGFQNMHTNVVTFSLIRAICPFPDPTIAAGYTYTFNIICNAVYNIIPHLNIHFTTSYFIYSYIFKKEYICILKLLLDETLGQDLLS